MPIRGGTPPGCSMNCRGSSVGSSKAGHTARMVIPRGRSSVFTKAASGDRMVTAFSFTDTVSSIACCRRSARLAATFMNEATDRAPAARRMFSIPAMVLGKERPTIREMMASTTIISIRVTPRRPESLPRNLFPVDDVGIGAFAARLPVGAVADDVGLFAVLAGVAVNVRVLPRVQRIKFLQIRPQHFQTLLLRGKDAVVGMILHQGAFKVIDLHQGRGDTRFVGLLKKIRPDQYCEQSDDDYHHHHLNQGHASLGPSSSILYLHMATSLMLVIATRILRMNPPTITPITRMTTGSKIAVKRLMAALVSSS